MKRHAIPFKKSQRKFSKTAGFKHVHPKNVLSGQVMRGGRRI